MTVSIEGKVVLITGAASGIGRATALRFAKAGALVVLGDRDSAVSALAAEIEAAGGQAAALEMDAGAEADVIAAVTLARERFGGLDACFANAGITGGPLASYFDATPEAWAEILRVNLIGPYLAIRHAAPEMQRRGGGSIIVTASVAGMRAGAGPAAYSASKAGVINLVQTAAQALAGSGIRVNALCPGLIETAMTKRLYDQARAAGQEDQIGRRNPMRRGGIPDEIAKAALFLVSDLASYVNGQAIPVDGGLSSSHPYSERPADPRVAVLR
ncbi:SDR family NAD(P)-dependent oxidoreductase [Falsigemmobacter faecalis]|uniref:SDR family oxidoreductase n=1 Tax=Falsigemmobacter faecalis TaxID=2488730 RepID=A0A3P3DID1_9RHOB|nr:SDR family NAD(P)-dependent oxidoreductase [Falsigemmobacter faecalis]RRH72378.1 SDR family oxidoreductase [Falsigemmobacter faecalis]